LSKTAAALGRGTRAREAGLAAMADEIIAISDADYTGPDGHADNALVQQARLRVDARRWLLAKLLPKRYGDRVELVGDASAPLITRVELIAVAPRRIDTTPVTIEHDDAKSGDE